MVCGATSGVGRTVLVTGLCRALAQAGVSVAPFSARVVTAASTVTPDGSEIAASVYTEAAAARAVPEWAMNPVVLLPVDDRTYQLVVGGTRQGTVDAATVGAACHALGDVVVDALADLRRRFDVVVCDGADGPTGRSLLGSDADRLDLAERAGIPVVFVGDVGRGAVFRGLLEGFEHLTPARQALVQGFVLNQHLGDPARLDDAIETLSVASGLPTFGVMPHLYGVAIDQAEAMETSRFEDSWADDRFGTGGDGLMVSVVRLPHLANVGDFDPLRLEPAVHLRFVDSAREVAHADMVILPGTDATLADLAWLRAAGFVDVLQSRRRAGSPPTVMGIGGSYAMLGRRIEDPEGYDGPPGAAEGLGWLDVVTEFAPDTVAARRSGTDPAKRRTHGFELHRGRPRRGDGSLPLFVFDDGTEEGARDDAAGVYGTMLHGAFESDEARFDLLHIASVRRGKAWLPSRLHYAAERELQIIRLAHACEHHLDLDALWSAVGLVSPSVAQASF